MSTEAMDHRGLQHAHGGNTSGFDNPFSAVLQEIYTETQREIEARNRSVGSQFGALSQSVEMLQPSFSDSSCRYEPLLQPSFSDSSCRYEPLLRPSFSDSSCRYEPLLQPSFSNSSGRYEPLCNPALSYLSGILAEEDEPNNNDPLLSPEAYIAYQAKATEVAALLKEDSPALPLNIDRGNPSSPDSNSLTSVSEDSYSDSHGSRNLSYLDLDSSYSVCDIPDASRNEVLLTSLRGPSCKPVLNFAQPYSHEVSSAESFGSVQLTQPIEAGSQDDIGMRGYGNKQQKPADKTGKGLRPRKEKSITCKKSAGKARSSKEGDQEVVDINDLLVQCAQAVNNTKRAVELLNKVKQHCSPYGNGAERLAYYFAEAMDARFSGTGWPLYLGHLRRRPSSAEILRATYLYMASCPFVKAYHYFINQSILNVARTAAKVHILELQVDGFQYPSLFRALADRPGGPPEVHVIGLNFPHYSMLPVQAHVVLEAVQKTGRQLSDYAALCGVPFQFTPWAGIREDLCMQELVSPYRSAGEVLVILSTSLLRYVMDETLDSSTLRSKLLKQGRDVNPDVYVQGIVTGSYSTPFFTRRFREALFHFESVFDMLDTFIDKDQTDRLVFESEILGKAILHVVACEGTELIERIDKYKHWQAVTEEVGFQQLPLNEEVKNNVQDMLKSYHKEYTVAEDSQYLLMGWKGRMLHAMSTWKATAEGSP